MYYLCGYSAQMRKVYRDILVMFHLGNAAAPSGKKILK
jgi:hypothetical protein